MLFTIGPVQMYERTLKKKAEQIPYFRNNEFSEMMFETDKMLKNLLGTSEKTKCIYLTASGTAAMEAAVINVFSNKDKLLVVVGGTFGKRFSIICDVYGIPHTDIVLKNGEPLTKEKLSIYVNQGYTGFLVNLHETSTGQLYDIDVISEFCHTNDVTLVVDAISTFLCDDYNMDKFGIDVTILSSQKGLCSSPGISIVALNEKTFNNRVLNNSPQTLYFDFKDYEKNFSRGQTPFTPAIGILYEINDFLKYIIEKGINNHLSEIKSRADYFRNIIQSDNIVILKYKMSNAITPVIFDKPIAKKLYDYLKNKKNIVVNPSGGEVSDYQIRISHIGALNNDDYKVLVDEITKFLIEI